MPEHYVPPGYTRVIPYLTVDGAQHLIDFITSVFSAELLERNERPDGKVAHAALRIGDSTIELAEASDRFGPRPGSMHIYVPDTDHTHRLALEHGAKLIHEPMDMEYGERASAVEDVTGNQWYIASFTGT